MVETNADVPPENVFEGYRIGARTNDQLKLLVSQAGVTTEYASRIVMQGSQSSREKSFEIGRVGTANSISGNIITLTENHDFINGESIRIISDSGQILMDLNQTFSTLLLQTLVILNQIRSELLQQRVMLYHLIHPPIQRNLHLMHLVVNSPSPVESLIRDLVTLVTQFSMMVMRRDGISMFLLHLPTTKLVLL